MKLTAHFKEDAFAALYERLMPKLLAFAYRWCGDQQLAEDAVQETFVKLWQKRADIQWDDSIDRLLYTMVRNRLINAYHQRLREQILATDLKRTDDDGHAEPNFEILLNIEQPIAPVAKHCEDGGLRFCFLSFLHFCHVVSSASRALGVAQRICSWPTF